MRSLLGEIVELTQQSLPGRPEASITLLTGDRPTTPVASGAFAVALDESQYDAGQGPCLHAAESEQVVEVRDTRTDGRWPGFLPVAAEQGCLSSLSLPLPLHEGVTGALNVYARAADAFDGPARDVAVRFASYAAVVAGNMLVYESALDRARNLEAAIASRAVIDQAKGILMERCKITADVAFQTLSRVSMQTNTKVRDVAARFVETGELGDARPR
jgi:GAF domain-containing protein